VLLVGSDVAAPGGKTRVPRLVPGARGCSDASRPSFAHSRPSVTPPKDGPTFRLLRHAVARRPDAAGRSAAHIAPYGSSRPRWPTCLPPRTPPASFTQRSARPRLSLTLARRGWADFGAGRPGSRCGPLGVWAFTAPEHRDAGPPPAALSVRRPATCSALAATICVARAGMLPWSDPVSWADGGRPPIGRRHCPGGSRVIRARVGR